MRLITILILFLPALCFSQQTAFFETTFYFEDAIGNKDTIVIGHDPAVDNSVINPQLGEIEIVSPWDSIFEVRACHSGSWFASEPVWLNKVIGGIELQNFQNILDEYSCYLIQEWYYIAVHALHKPVTITWDPTVFETNYCKVRSTLGNHDLGLFFPNWTGPDAIGVSTCLAEDSIFVTDLIDCCGSDMERTIILEGGEEGIANGLFFQFQAEGSAGDHCSADYTVDIKEFDELKDDLLYPNPTTSSIYFQDGKARRYQILDINGLFIQRGEGNEINLQSLPSGIYLIHYQYNSQSQIERVVKMRS